MVAGGSPSTPELLSFGDNEWKTTRTIPRHNDKLFAPTLALYANSVVLLGGDTTGRKDYSKRLFSLNVRSRRWDEWALKLPYGASEFAAVAVTRGFINC